MVATLDTRQKIIFTLKLAAPYLAVVLGLYVFHNAWLSIFLYHGQIIFWWLIGRTQKTSSSPKIDPTETRVNLNTKTYLNLPKQIENILNISSKVMLPISALAGIACYFLLPFIVQDASSLNTSGLKISSLSEWLTQNKLTGNALLLLIPYFGIIHPPIEQLHWHPLTKLPKPYNYISHLAFAAYHGLVLYPILQPFWVIVCIVILSSISFLWSFVRQQNFSNPLKGQYLSCLSHILADIGIVTATYLLVRGL